VQARTGRLSRVVEGARRAYRAVGLLVPAAAVMSAIALYIHHTSPLLPRPYTVFEPLRTLKDVVALPWFMVAVLATFLVGRVRRRGEWRLDAALGAFREHVSLRAMLPLGGRVLLALVLVVAYAALFDGPTVFDLLALGALAVFATERRRPISGWARLAAQTVLASLVFLAICYSYTILKSLTFAGREQVDAQIIAIERGIFGMVPHRVIAAWVSRHPSFVVACDWVYFRFFHHMALTTVLLVALRLGRERIEYLGALALCYVLGGPLYHVWPGAGPGYYDPGTYAFVEHHVLLTNVIRGWLYANTRAVLSGQATVVRTWGYIACMPSLHIAQELVMLYYARHSRFAFAVACAFTAVTLVSVVALGWHYPLDCIGGGFVAAFAIKVAHWQRDALLPPIVSDETDVELPPRRPFARAWIERSSG